MPDLPPTFLPLPLIISPSQSRSIQQAHAEVSTSYAHAYEALFANEHDKFRLLIHIDKLSDTTFSVFNALATEIADANWCISGAAVLALLLVSLKEQVAGIESRVDVDSEAQIETAPLFELEYTGRPGRPRKVVSAVWLNEVHGRHIPSKLLAGRAQVHRHTFRRALLGAGHKRYTDISDADLDATLQAHKACKPHVGYGYLTGHLRQQGIRVPRRRLRDSLQRIDPLGRTLRKRKVIRRRRYQVPHSNYMWHMDGHHKLIKWGVVIHGFIDGHDHTVIELRAHTNNRSRTVLRLFIRGVNTHGAPHRVRGDKGGENLDTAIWMIKYRGRNRASFLWGPSTRNTRIERLWGEVGAQFARQWRAFFERLEDLHRLDPDDPVHRWLLHTQFLDEINVDCNNFVSCWNAKPIRTAGGKSPTDMRFLSQMEHGLPEKDPPTYSFADYSYDATIAEEEIENIRHAAIEPPPAVQGFDQGLLEHFWAALSRVQDDGVVPMRYGVHLSDTDYPQDGYPDVAFIKVGSRETVQVDMPVAIWLPRAVRWAQALDMYNTFKQL